MAVDSVVRLDQRFVLILLNRFVDERVESALAQEVAESRLVRQCVCSKVLFGTQTELRVTFQKALRLILVGAVVDQSLVSQTADHRFLGGEAVLLHVLDVIEETKNFSAFDHRVQFGRYVTIEIAEIITSIEHFRWTAGRVEGDGLARCFTFGGASNRRVLLIVLEKFGRVMRLPFRHRAGQPAVLLPGRTELLCRRFDSGELEVTGLVLIEPKRLQRRVEAGLLDVQHIGDVRPHIAQYVTGG